MVYKNRLVGIISSSDVIAVTPDLVEIVSEKATIIRGELGIARSASNVSGFCDQCGNGQTYYSMLRIHLSVKYVGANRLVLRERNSISFLADAMLGSIARKLRIFGFDTIYLAHARDDEILKIGIEQDRVILTADKELFKRIVKVGGGVCW